MSDFIVTVGANVTPFNQAIDRAANQTRRIGNLDVRGFSQPLGRITGQASEFTKALEAANARVIAFGASAGAIAALKISFDKLLSSTIEVEKSLVDINTLLNVSTRDLQKFGAGLFQIANQTSVSFRDAAEAATEFSRQGLGAAETLNRTRAAMVLAKLSGTDFAQSVNSLTAAINSFKRESLDAIDIVNRLAAVDARFAVSADDLAEGIKRVGSSASDANVTLNQTIALITAAQQTTARGGAVIGNSFKTIFTRLQRPAVLQQLEQIGIQTKLASGEVRPLIDVLADLSKRYDSLAPSQRAYTAEIVGGVFQINVLKAVLADLGNGFSVYDGALKAATSTTGEAERRIDQLNQTISSKLTQTLNSFTQFGSALGGAGFSDIIKQGLDFGGFTADSLTKGLNAEGIGGDLARGITKGIGNILGGPGIQLLTFALFKLFEKLATFGASATKEFFGLSSQAERLQAVQRETFRFLDRHPELLSQIANGTLTVEQLQNQITEEISDQNTLLQEQERISGRIADNMVRGGASVAPNPATGLSGRAKGFVPNFSMFAREEQEAMALGASAGVKAHMSKGTIGGRKFVMNNQETEIPGFGRNGDSAVLPSMIQMPTPTLKQLQPKSLRSMVVVAVA
jgi:TP901 family phage tail tape measure protein